MRDAYVIGAGLAELAAALELAEVGLSVTVGLPEGHPALDTGVRFTAPAAAAGDDARPVPDTEGAIADLLRQAASPLGGEADESAEATGERAEHSTGSLPGRSEAMAPEFSAPGTVLLRDAKGGWSPQPVPAIIGIPAVPLSSRAMAVLGGGGATRAYLDRIKPVLTIGKTDELGPLVRARLGDAALQRLVEPFVRAGFGLDADSVEVAVAAPGLNEALTRAGALSAAALAQSERGVARETRVVAAGGWSAFGQALLERLGWYGVEFEAHPVTSAVRGDDGWSIAAGGSTVEARALVVGLDGDAAASIPVGPLEIPGRDEALGEPRVRAHVEVVIADPELPEVPADEAPGQGRTVALQTVDVPGAGRWAVELIRGGGAWTAHASGPAESVTAPSVEDAARSAIVAIGETGARPLDGEPAVAVRIAPFASTEERAEALARLAAQREEDRELLLIGDAVHGGDLSAAVADARLAAVHLRRRLVGIAD